MAILTPEVTSLINLLESDIPANPRSPANERKASRLERKLQDYFKALEQAFPYDDVEILYNRHVEVE